MRLTVISTSDIANWF